MHDRSLVLLFIKAPEKGKVKSRLSKVLGEDLALAIYKALVRDILETLDSGKYSFRPCFYPAGSGQIVKEWLGNTYSYSPQQGNDLGERMRNAIARAFSDGMEKVIVIGSDIPELTGRIISEAFDALDTNDAVLGPAFDGGYYLIGFKRETFLPAVFHGIEWGAASVFSQTMEVLERSGLGVHVLTELTDIDTFEDLQSFLRKNATLWLNEVGSAKI